MPARRLSVCWVYDRPDRLAALSARARRRAEDLRRSAIDAADPARRARLLADRAHVLNRAAALSRRARSAGCRAAAARRAHAVAA